MDEEEEYMQESEAPHQGGDQTFAQYSYHDSVGRPDWLLMSKFQISPNTRIVDIFAYAEYADVQPSGYKDAYMVTIVRSHLSRGWITPWDGINLLISNTRHTIGRMGFHFESYLRVNNSSWIALWDETKEEHAQAARLLNGSELLFLRGFQEGGALQRIYRNWNVERNPKGPFYFQAPGPADLVMMGIAPGGANHEAYVQRKRKMEGDGQQAP